MAITVEFYQNQQDPRSIPKQLSSPYTKSNVKIKGSIDMLYPVFDLAYDSNLLTKNYCKAWGKSYFITGITLDSAERMYVSCAIDVLNTYSTDILTSYGTCIRNEGIGKPTYIVDANLPVLENQSENTNVNFGNTFQGTFFNSDPQFMLITI